MVYCQECFDPQAHAQHPYLEGQVRAPGVTCDCGRVLRLDRASMCVRHTGQIAKEVLIDEGELGKFRGFYEQVFEICLFLEGW